MSQKTISVCYSDGRFWQDMSDGLGDYQALFDMTLADRIANSEKYSWSLSVKTKKQRKYRMLSVQSKSIVALLGHVVEYLNNDACILAITPDLVIDFYKD